VNARLPLLILAGFLATTATQLGLSGWMRRRTYRPRRSATDRPQNTVDRIVGERTHRFDPRAAYGWTRRGRARVSQEGQAQS
jgi:hypothetical protein